MIDNAATDALPDSQRSSFCKECEKGLCLRQTVVNYALGNDEELYCLTCLAAQSQSGAAELVADLREYILGRECFAKEWKKI